VVLTALISCSTVSYDFFLQVSQAYRKIFDELGVPWIRVAGDTGVIGGSESHEFHYPAGIGKTRENERGERSWRLGYVTSLSW
jgi:prolyl-tRNA synthetase